ncbi:unnamed protein product [Lactuca saligna]|uniref:Replication protein A subunit n=1 Tax=Lactuca saligna TaxID=75948 RepID=A0AA35YLK6_LACSI|nr:unnamed protein product [Lactuca saligna]
MATSNITFIKDIDPVNSDFTIKVKVLKLWMLNSKFNENEKYSIEMILLDEQGSLIQANVFQNLFYKFEKSLREGSVYEFTTLSVAKHNPHPKSTIFSDLPNKITFIRETELKESLNFPKNVFGLSFVDFQKINSKVIPTQRSVDVIGVVVSRTTIIPSQKKDKQRIHLELKNLDGVLLKVTLWGHFANKVSDYLDTHNTDDCVVIIVQFAKINDYKGISVLQVTMMSQLSSSTLILMKSNTLEKSWLAKDNESSQLSGTISLIRTKHVSLNDDFLKNNEVKTIYKSKEPVQVEEFIIVGTIIGIRQDKPWCYQSCPDCHVKAVEIPDCNEDVKLYKCTNVECNNSTKVPIPRYMIPVCVQDDSASTILTMFDREAYGLLGISAKDLAEKHTRLGFSLGIYPPELNFLKNKHLAFKVSVTKYNVRFQNSVYTISRVTEEKQIIESLERKLLQLQDSVSHSDENVTPSTGNILTPTSFENVKSTSMNLTRKFEEVYDVEQYSNSSSTKALRLSTGTGEGIKLLIPKVEKSQDKHFLKHFLL